MRFLGNVERRLDQVSEDRFYLVLLTLLAAVVACLMTMFALLLHRNFLTIACDTAEFQNAIVNTLDGRWFRDTAYDGPSVLGLHSVLVLALIAPIYAVFPSPTTLFILQVWGIYSAVIPLYLLAVEMTQRRPASFLIALSALASPLFLHMALAPYHPESWIIAALLWSCYFYRRNRPRAFWIALVIAVTSGEQAGPIYIALGASLLLFDDGVPWRKRYGRYALAAGIAWMIFAVGILAPLTHVPEQQNLIAYHYSQWNSTSGGQLVLAWLLHPVATLATLLSPARWVHLFLFVGLPLVLAFFSRRSLVLLLPLPVRAIRGLLRADPVPRAPGYRHEAWRPGPCPRDFRQRTGARLRPGQIPDPECRSRRGVQRRLARGVCRHPARCGRLRPAPLQRLPIEPQQHGHGRPARRESRFQCVGRKWPNAAPTT
jgi:hypothetical protein